MRKKLKVLDLFSGIGGFSLGLERAGFETVAFCEIDPFCQQVLSKHWPDVPIHSDIRSLKGEQVGSVDVICGGYPCQPFSLAGKREGKGDDRHLWPEYLRLIRELRPRWVIGENVAGHISMGLDDVLSDLEREGYTWEAFVIPACAVDARHRRDRVWIIANSNSNGQQKREHVSGFGEDQIKTKQQRNKDYGANKQNGVWPNSKCRKRSLGGAIGRNGRFEQSIQGIRIGKNETEPVLARGEDGIPNRVDRLRALGNAAVPQIPEIIGRAIREQQWTS